MYIKNTFYVKDIILLRKLQKEKAYNKNISNGIISVLMSPSIISVININILYSGNRLLNQIKPDCDQ